MKEIRSIYIVDDDPVQSMMLADHLGKYSYLNVQTFQSGEECMKKMETEQPQIIFLDYYFDKVGVGAMNGLDILKAIKAKSPQTEVIMWSGQDKIEVAVNTMKYGAFDYIVKSESAFHRSENVIFNIIRKLKLQNQASTYKRLTYVFAIAFVIMIIVVFALWKMGMISNNP